MTMEQLIREITDDLGIPKTLTDKAMLFGQMTAFRGRRVSGMELSEKDEHIIRMYFRTLLFRMFTDPDYQRAVEQEIQKRVERN